MRLTRNPDYVDDGSLTRDQFKARSLYRRSQKRLMLIHDALMVCPIKSRAQLHERLDRALDDIARLEAEALRLDPKVHSRLTVASGSINLD